MRKLLGIVAVVALAAPNLQAAAPPQPRASESPKAAFIKKCFRDRTKRSCTAPPEARAVKYS